MRKNLLKTVIVLSIGLLTYETTYSLPQLTLNKADDFSIEIGTVSKSTFSSCGNSIANCLVTLKLMIPNEGFVIIHNNSSRTLTNVRAYFPEELQNQVNQNASACISLAPGLSCRLTFRPTTMSQFLERTAIPIHGDKTSTAFFDLQITE
ncbi:TPA: hypothetical protein JBB31_08975 [Legionella pneumophila subsp. pneumophila]|uniref:hypothetical protein n=1 Tax=Legionella pneumophila TaxID=446 RepID=UPI0005CA4C2F|nr:hypothetical protein [Legionella pneumophila]HAT8828662.1 hypothetical protein [Legionella pneumophila subsp. pneumophila]WAI73666.1 hypothetical protein OXA90_01675 [Legionella pneumophila]WAI79521.1 hypothetical protein OXA86_01500 [Legionella pneumophila]CZJ49419.1 Uncharacterised protein [Legionella pneumophila]CZJ80466.1 Uncharacterised protein [Legionella pneumophila]